MHLPPKRAAEMLVEQFFTVDGERKRPPQSRVRQLALVDRQEINPTIGSRRRRHGNHYLQVIGLLSQLVRFLRGEVQHQVQVALAKFLQGILVDVKSDLLDSRQIALAGPAAEGRIGDEEHALAPFLVVVSRRVEEERAAAHRALGELLGIYRLVAR